MMPLVSTWFYKLKKQCRTEPDGKGGRNRHGEGSALRPPALQHSYSFSFLSISPP